MSESKLKKTDQEVVVGGSGRSWKANLKKHWLKLAIVVVIVLVVIAAWLIYKSHHQNRHVNPNVGMSQAINATNGNVPASKYTSYEEASSAGDIYDAENKEAQAYVAYQRALQLTNKPSVNLYSNLGRIATTLHKPADAQKYAKDALTAYDFNTLNNVDKRALEAEANQ